MALMSRRLGQHFLADRRVLERVACALGLEHARRPLLLEIGAGRGALTELLAERAALVVAVEIDPVLAAYLREKFATRSNVRVVEADILELPLAPLLAELGYRRARAVGNLPYYITSPLLMRLFEWAEMLEEIVVMVQREVAERLAAAPGSRAFSLLSVTAQYYTRPELLFRIPPRAFRPPPKVESALVRMPVTPRREALGIREEAAFFRFLRACFRQKRKTLRNNLKGAYPPDRVLQTLQALGLNPAARAETFSVEQFAALYHRLGRPLPDQVR